MGDVFLVKKILIASDHAGFELKEYLITALKKYNLEIEDLGCDSAKNSVDYPDFAEKLCQKISENNFGILICGSGTGVTMCANRHKHVRAALCYNKNITQLSRSHNNANVICLGARFTKKKLALSLCKTFLTKKFDGNRHTNRIKKFS